MRGLSSISFSYRHPPYLPDQGPPPSAQPSVLARSDGDSCA
jgi:hypothetical protein